MHMQYPSLASVYAYASSCMDSFENIRNKISEIINIVKKLCIIFYWQNQFDRGKYLILKRKNSNFLPLQNVSERRVHSYFPSLSW